jgi:hypothetical protein
MRPHSSLWRILPHRFTENRRLPAMLLKEQATIKTKPID